MKIMTCLWYELMILLFVPFTMYSQPSGQAKEVVDLINFARTQPSQFLIRYKTDVERYSAKFAKLLKDAKPTQKVTWDNGIADMQKEKVAKGNLNPKYPGKMEGFNLSSSGSGIGSFESLELLCQFYTCINDPDETHFGIYIIKGRYAFAWGRSSAPSFRKSFSYRLSPDTSKVDFCKLNTANNENYMSRFEREMIEEINFVRMYPTIYADIVGETMQKQSVDWNGLSKDEIFATNELIAELKSAKPLGLLYPKDCLYRSAEKHGLDCKKRGFIDHTGSDGSNPFDRITKFCDDVNGSENIVGTIDGDVRKSVIVLLVDSGISSRGHRYNMLDPKWKYVGCYQYTEGPQEYPKDFIIGDCIQNFSE